MQLFAEFKYFFGKHTFGRYCYNFYEVRRVTFQSVKKFEKLTSKVFNRDQRQAVAVLRMIFRRRRRSRVLFSIGQHATWLDVVKEERRFENLNISES